MKGLGAALLCLLCVSGAIADGAKRTGPDVLERWFNATENLRSVHFSGTRNGIPCDEFIDENIHDDLFGLRRSIGERRFIDQAPDGTQVWDYLVSENITYRVWLKESPLRILERQVFERNQLIRTFHYSDFEPMTITSALPRHILVTDGTAETEWKALSLTSAPPVIRLTRPDKSDLPWFAEIASLRGDETGLLRIFSEAIPSNQNDLTDTESAILADVAEIAFDRLGSEEILERAIFHDPGNSRLTRKLVDALMRIGEEAAAIRAAERFMRARNRDLASVEFVADLLRRTGDLDALDDLYESSAIHSPDEPHFLFQLGQLRMSRKDLVGGEDAYDSLVLILDKLPHAERAEWSFKIASSYYSEDIALWKARRLAGVSFGLEPNNELYRALHNRLELEH